MQTSAIPKLSNSTLSKLPSGVKIPNYNRSNLTAGIVHIGLGNFHRAQNCSRKISLLPLLNYPRWAAQWKLWAQ